MFEILRVDTSGWHMLYNKDGSLEDPVPFPPTVLPENANSGASQPTVPFVAMAVDPSPSQPVIGRGSGDHMVLSDSEEAQEKAEHAQEASWNNSFRLSPDGGPYRERLSLGAYGERLPLRRSHGPLRQ